MIKCSIRTPLGETKKIIRRHAATNHGLETILVCLVQPIQKKHAAILNISRFAHGGYMNTNQIFPSLLLFFIVSPLSALGAPGDISFQAEDLSIANPSNNSPFSVYSDVYVHVEGFSTLPAIGWSFSASITPLAEASGTAYFSPSNVQAGEPNLPAAKSNTFTDFDLDFEGMSYGKLGDSSNIIEATSTYISPQFSAPPTLDANGNLQVSSSAGLVSLPITFSSNAAGNFQISFDANPLFTGIAYVTDTEEIAFHPLATSVSGIVTVTQTANLPGDYTNNGRIDGADFLLWQRQLGMSGPQLSADGNKNGTVDSGDLAIWEENFGEPHLNGDFNRDSSVNGADFLIWQRQVGMSGQLSADGNGDGSVDSADLSIWQTNYSTSSASIHSSLAFTVPEPNAAPLLASSITGLAFLRRRKVQVPTGARDLGH